MRRRSASHERLRPYVLAWRRFRRRELTLADLAYGRATSFSQFGEDVVLAELFAGRDTGFYVDVGAYDPFSMSNTYLLYRRGWHGINLEPDPAAHERLVRHRPRDVNLALAVSERSGRADFVLKGSFSGIDDDRFLWPGGDAEAVIGVETRRLDEILAEHVPAGQVVDLLDVDCEGHDLTVLRTNDWATYRPQVVLAESHDEGDDVLRLLRGEGYELFARLGPTGVFVAA